VSEVDTTNDRRRALTLARNALVIAAVVLASLVLALAVLVRPELLLVLLWLAFLALFWLALTACCRGPQLARFEGTGAWSWESPGSDG